MDNKNGAVLRGTRIIIPTILQIRIVNHAYTCHQGLFPQYGQGSKTGIEACLPCQMAITVIFIAHVPPDSILSSHTNDKHSRCPETEIVNNDIG